MRNLKSKWKELLSIPTNTKEMARLKEEIENEQ
jgi:hypothetical protein